MVLGACATATETLPEMETTTEVETTIEAETTVEDVTTQEIEITQPHILTLGREMRLSDAITIFEFVDRWHFAEEIWMSNTQTGQEALLLSEWNYSWPSFYQRVNERFFTFHYLWEGGGPFPAGIYDVVRMQRHMLDYEIRTDGNGRIFVYNPDAGFGLEWEDVPVYYFYATELEEGELPEFRSANMNVGQLRAMLY